jgi:hypothetical protein
MEPESSLPHSQQPATCPYPEGDKSKPWFRTPLNTLRLGYKNQPVNAV